MSTKPIALITGASAGIGQELARVFAERGYDLMLCARREQRLQELAKELRRYGQVDTFAIDLSKPKGPEKLFQAVQATGREIDTLVNNAGIAYQGKFHEMRPAEIHNMLGLNMRAIADTTHLFLPGMLERGSGKILNVSSVVGFQAIPGMALYSASKAFVLSFTESLAEELRCQGIKVSALCPGLTRTEMVSDLKTDEIPGSELIMGDAKAVAIDGYNALHRGVVIQIPGFINQMVVNWSEYQPRWLKRTLAGFASRATFTRS